MEAIWINDCELQITEHGGGEVSLQIFKWCNNRRTTGKATPPIITTGRDARAIMDFVRYFKEEEEEKV